MERRAWTTAGISTVVLLVVMAAAPFAGSASIDYLRALRGESPHAEILFYARLPRVLLASLAGGGLATAGVLFQALLRDPLATPYTLGVSSGASLGAVVAIVFGWSTTLLPAVWLAAFAGALITLVVVLGVASEGKRVSSFTLLLAGVTINSICIALILLLHSMVGFTKSFAISRWLMGSIEVTSYVTIAALAVMVVVITIAVFMRAREWNLLMAGDEWAAARGVDTSRVLLFGYLAASAVTGCVTALTGPIGFVGLIVPHALRLRLGADHRVLIPNAFLVGAAFLVLCDTASRTLLGPAEIPVGVITALIGGPFFVWMLRSRRRSLWL